MGNIKIVSVVRNNEAYVRCGDIIKTLNVEKLQVMLKPQVAILNVVMLVETLKQQVVM
jgi:hypothetical protein